MSGSDRLDRVVCVHASAFGKDVEFRFPRARYAVEAGALRVLSDALEPEDFMAFAPGTWKAAWFEDSVGRPLGLAPPSKPEPSKPEPSAQAPAPPGPGAELAKDSSSRAALSRKIADALAAAPYPGLGAFAASLGEPAWDVERSLTAALQQQALEPDALAIASIQRFLDSALPEIIAQRQPNGLREMLQHVKERPDGQDCDFVQLHIWLKRNPIKRST